MQLNRKIWIMAGMAIAVVACAAAASPAPPAPAPPASAASALVFMDRLPGDGGEFRNLKVLPRDISPKMLQHIMIDEFDDGMGVGCGFCHAPFKGSDKLDYASDAKPEKEIARSMMRMSLQMNKKYFQARHPQLGTPELVVTCTTCHHGQPRPDNGNGE